MAFEAMLKALAKPDNYLVLRSEQDWLKLYKAASDKNDIMCIEFYEDNFSACLNTSQYFLELARTFSNLLFIQVRLSGMNKWAVVRKSVGGVEYVPCIVIISFTFEGAKRAKFEGEREIELAIRGKLIHDIIKEFKVAKGLEEMQAVEALSRLVEDGKEQRERANEKEEEVQELKKRMEEIEQSRTQEEQKKERTRLAKEDRERNILEERRVNRPIILNELNQEKDIESLSVGKLKDMFKRLHISIVGFTEKHELLHKLYEEFPELRNKQRNVFEAYACPNNSMSPPGATPTTPTHQSFSSNDDNIYALSDQAIEKLTVAQLKKYITKYGLESEGPFSERSELIHAVKKKRDSACKSACNSQLFSQNSSQGKSEINELNGKIMDLTEKLTETKILSICRLYHFEIVQTHRVSHSDKICHNTVRCRKEGLPDSNKLYTLNGVFNYFDSMLEPQTIRVINEFEILSTLQPHPNILYHCAIFYDKPTNVLVPSRNISLDNIALFSILECLPYSICTYLSRNHKNAAIKSNNYLEWMRQIISAFLYLFEKSVFLRSIKHDNIMYDPDANVLKLVGFDSAISSNTVPFYTELTSIGDLNSYLPPEILNAIPGPSNFLDYTSHYVWAAGALSYDLACNPSPFTDRVDPSQYNDRDIPILSCIYPYGSLSRANSNPIIPEYASLVTRMLGYRPLDRPGLSTILSVLDTAVTP